jgi:anionic cell wall polymer biosynthesis LytR-Cps2A-Psr (LCP) family protein
MCLQNPMKDADAGINLPAGCQTLNGANALGYVRSRKTAATPGGDLDRARHQREMMAAVLKKVSGPGTLANPFALWPLVTDTAKSLRVDNGDHIWNLGSLGWALHSDLVTTTVPVGNPDGHSDVGSVVLWDKARAGRFFAALANDQQLPPDLLTKG